MPDETFAEWCVVELMGHRRIAARVTEQTLAGHGFLRLDEPATGDVPGRTQLVSPSSVYALHPTTEEVVRLMASQWRSAPIQRWELHAAIAEVEAIAAESEADGPDTLAAVDDNRHDYDDEGPF